MGEIIAIKINIKRYPEVIYLYPELSAAEVQSLGSTETKLLLRVHGLLSIIPLYQIQALISIDCTDHLKISNKNTLQWQGAGQHSWQNNCTL